MKTESRLLAHGADDFERDLLNSAKADAPGESAQLRVLAALGVSAAAASMLPAASATRAASASTGAGVAFAKGMALVLVAGGVAGYLVRSLASHRPPSATYTVASTIEPSSTASLPTSATSPTTQLDDPPLLPAPADMRPTRAPAPGVPATALPGDTTVANRAKSYTPSAATAAAEAPSSMPSAGPDLEAETHALDQVRSALRQHRPEDALRALDAYTLSFPNGTFEPESTALRVEALLAMGDRASAERLGQDLLRAHPTSPSARQVRVLLNL